MDETYFVFCDVPGCETPTFLIGRVTGLDESERDLVRKALNCREEAWFVEFRFVPASGLPDHIKLANNAEADGIEDAVRDGKRNGDAEFLYRTVQRLLDSKRPVPKVTYGDMIKRALERMPRLQTRLAYHQPTQGNSRPPKPDSPTGYVAPRELAAKYGVDVESLRKRLERWRSRHDTGYVEATNPSPKESRYLYNEAAVMPVIKAMKRVRRTSGKK